MEDLVCPRTEFLQPTSIRQQTTSFTTSHQPSLILFEYWCVFSGEIPVKTRGTLGKRGGVTHRTLEPAISYVSRWLWYDREQNESTGIRSLRDNGKRKWDKYALLLIYPFTWMLYILFNRFKTHLRKKKNGNNNSASALFLAPLIFFFCFYFFNYVSFSVDGNAFIDESFLWQTLPAVIPPSLSFLTLPSTQVSRAAMKLHSVRL